MVNWLEKLRHEVVDIIQWIDDPGQTLVWRFPRYRNEIKNGARLVVRPGQVAIFVNEGQLADVFGPGTHELTTANLPILRTLKSWKHGFESPFKAEVYFVRTAQVTGLKWGTPNPIMMRDADFGPIRLRAYGTYNLQCTDPKALLEQLVGTDDEFETDEVAELIRSFLASGFADVVGSAQIAALDLAANYGRIAEDVRLHVREQIGQEYGLDMTQLLIVNISLPEEVEKALDTRSSIGVIGDMARYQQYQMGKAVADAANNPAGGGAAEGMGLGVGLAMAQQVMAQQQAMQQAAGGQVMMPAPGAIPPPPPPPSQTIAWHLAVDGRTLGPFNVEGLRELIAQGQLTRHTHVWRAGLAAWQTAEQTPEVAALFGPPAPPDAE